MHRWRHSGPEEGARRLWLVVALWLACVGATFTPSSDASALEIRVRAQGQLAASASAAGTLVQVGGSLTDEVGHGLPQRPIELRFVDEATGEVVADERVFTGRGGGFEAWRELAPGRWRVDVVFPGSEHVTSARVTRLVETVPAEVELSVRAPGFIRGEPRIVPFKIRARIGDVGLEGRAEVYVNGARLSSVELDQFGRATADVAPALATGINSVEARIPASRYRSRATAQTSVRVSETVGVEARLEEVFERLERGLAVVGHVYDDEGLIPNARVEVNLVLVQAADADERLPADADEDYVQTTQTGEDGSFRVFFPGEDLPDGIWQAEVQVVPDLGGPVRAQVEQLELDRTASRWTLNALGILGLLAGLALLGQRAWRIGLIWFAEWRRRRELMRREEQAFAEEERLVPEVLPAEAGGSHRDRAATTVGGLVWDVWRERPITDARLSVVGGDGQPVRTTASDGAGRFALQDLPPGRHEIVIEADGFVPARMDAKIPHDGDLARVRLSLVAVPLKIRRLYQSVVATLEGEDLWGRLSPREIERVLLEVAIEVDRAAARQGVDSQFVERLRRRLETSDDLDPQALVAVMTAIVEETYFSGRTYGEDVWRLAREVALRLRDRLGETEAAT